MQGLTPIAGLLLGFGVIILTILTRTPTFQMFLDPISWLIVVGGAFASTVISFEPKHLLTSFRSLVRVFRPKSYPYADTMVKLYRIAIAASTQGALGIEAEAEDITDPFFKKIVDLATVTTDHNELRDMIEVEMRVVRKEHRDNQEVFRRMGAYAPAFGMVGTLIGLILMLGSVEGGDVSQIAKNMATALVTTFIGLIAANLIFLPIATKIGEQSEREAHFYEFITEGVLAILSGTQSGRLVERLQIFVPPSESPAVDAAMDQARASGSAATA